MKYPVISKHDRVTNNLGWTGTVQRIDINCPHTPDNKYYWVWWREREKSDDKIVQRKPVCGHLITQIRLLDVSRPS